MKFDSSLVGEILIDNYNREGRIVDVSKEGNLRIRFKGNFHDVLLTKEFSFCCLFSRHFRIKNPQIQEELENDLEKEHQKQLCEIEKYFANENDTADFYITKDNDNGSREIIYKLKCEINQATEIMNLLILEQQREYSISHYTKKWRTIRLFDSETNIQLYQES